MNDELIKSIEIRFRIGTNSPSIGTEKFPHYYDNIQDAKEVASAIRTFGYKAVIYEEITQVLSVEISNE